MLVIAGLWGKVFPRLERVPSVQHRIKQLDELGVDTAAFFYTDHEGMKRWETEVDARAQLPNGILVRMLKYGWSVRQHLTSRVWRSC